MFGRLEIGDPSASGTLVGPLINERSYQGMVAALEEAQSDGGELLVGGGRREAAGYPDAYYVEPAIVRMPAQTELVRRETFAPILYVMTYSETSRRRSRSTTVFHKGCRRASSRATSGRPSSSSRPRDPTAGS